MGQVPVAEAKPQVTVIFDGLDNTPSSNRDWGFMYSSFEFKAMVNGGYIVRVTLTDPHFILLNDLITAGFLQRSRTTVLKMIFQIRWGTIPEATPPDKATLLQVAHVVSISNKDAGGDGALLEFVAVDPVSWALNTGDASGRVYKGKVSQVIRQVVNDYAPDVSIDIGETTDSAQNKWGMYRQDPKTFISSFLDWSSSITQQKTNWILAMDGYHLDIQEQAAIRSTQRGYYRYWDGPGEDSIVSWELLSNNALSIIETKIVTQGLSAVTGQYFDRTTDKDEQIVFAKDSNTQNKVIASADINSAFTKPDDSPGAGPPDVGWTSVQAIPEIYSGGELGLPYKQYIDGRARTMYLNLVNSLMRMRLRVIGHGEWSSGRGLGVDTIFVKWMAESKEDGPRRLYFLSGNWLVYGFHHVVSRGKWYTDLYVARYDYNSIARKAAGQPLT